MNTTLKTILGLILTVSGVSARAHLECHSLSGEKLKLVELTSVPDSSVSDPLAYKGKSSAFLVDLSKSDSEADQVIEFSGTWSARLTRAPSPVKHVLQDSNGQPALISIETKWQAPSKKDDCWKTRAGCGPLPKIPSKRTINPIDGNVWSSKKIATLTYLGETSEFTCSHF